MRRLIFTTLTAALFAVPLVAADADNDLLLKVKSAIAAEPTLRNVNLMVSVQDGVAVLGGAVPSAAVNDKLTKAVQSVPGIGAVRVNCWVPAGEDPLQSAVQAKLNPQPPTSNGLPVVRALPTGQSAYSPVPPPAPPAPAGPPDYPTIAPPRLPMTPSQDVAAAAEAVRAADSRYDGLKLTAKAGTVTITGTAADGADAWDLATAIRKVPGVDRVIVGRTSQK